MSQIKSIIDCLHSKSCDSVKRIYKNHGATNTLGVKVADMKSCVKNYKKSHNIGIELHNTYIEDAMYAAHFIIDPSLLTKDFFYNSLPYSHWYMISENSLANLLSRSTFAIELINEFIKSSEDHVKALGYSALAGYISRYDDTLLEDDFIRSILNYIKDNIHNETNRTKYVLNNLLICIGAYREGYYVECILLSNIIGEVKVNMGKTSCKVPNVEDYLLKMKQRNKIGIKVTKKTC